MFKNKRDRKIINVDPNLSAGDNSSRVDIPTTEVLQAVMSVVLLDPVIPALIRSPIVSIISLEGKCETHHFSSSDSSILRRFSFGFRVAGASDESLSISSPRRLRCFDLKKSL